MSFCWQISALFSRARKRNWIRFLGPLIPTYILTMFFNASIIPLKCCCQKLVLEAWDVLGIRYDMILLVLKYHLKERSEKSMQLYIIPNVLWITHHWLFPLASFHIFFPELFQRNFSLHLVWMPPVEYWSSYKCEGPSKSLEQYFHWGKCRLSLLLPFSSMLLVLVC